MPRETDYLLPEESNEILSMPNIETEIKNEIDRLTLSLIEEVKEVFNVGISYNSIEYVEDELTPEIPLSVYINEIGNEISRAIKAAISKEGLDYFNLFKIDGYDDTTGKAKVSIEIALPNTVNYAAIGFVNLKKKVR